MRFALATRLCLLAVLALVAADMAAAESAQSVRERYRAQLNDNTVTIMAGSFHATDLAVIQDIAAVLDDGDQMRVVPMVGKGPAQNLKDVLFMRGVDMGITQANVLKHFARTGELGPDLESQIAYVAKLFNEEMHVLARAETDDVRALEGQVVSFGPEGSGAEITARLVFEALGIGVRVVHLDEADAVAKLKAGEIGAAVVVTGKPAPILAHLEDGGLRLLPVPYAKGLEDEYYPATLTHDDYPALIAEGTRVDTLAVCAVLVSFNWASDNARYRKLDRFVNRFFSNFDAFMAPPRHPKWQQVNFAATLEGWQRSPLAEAWIERAKESIAADSGARAKFETFLAQADAGSASASEEERSKLFRAFLEWSKNQNKN
ncbi:MAG: TAXI family TRAP transporter solute-binding subunit [Methyloceanibacter sp.]|uniref:TAXI family TRAP transporter solute-binding subunit n=1 Tax=Methyloceanibacter sp. TaxID=1965321 RepID=UPI003D6DA029